LSKGTLFVVATPIGNLGDLSPRAREVLEQADRIAAEDTRVTGRLLSHFGIGTRQVALHEHNEQKVIPGLIEALNSGKTVALVSDAGTPLVSDPGFRLVRAAHEAGITVSPVPGPSALLAALSASGLPSDRFAFEGFLPSRRAARQARLDALKGESRTLLFFESVHRVAETLADLAQCFGRERQAFIGRELSKLHEQCVAAGLGTLQDMVADGRIPSKGEFVIGITGTDEDSAAQDSALADRLLEELVAVLPGRQAAEIVARATGGSRNDIYQRMLALRNEQS
jgi:16S rRNA (cytidine1402-2'-O)-methyltransferase